MNQVSVFFLHNIVYVYFFYGLAFFAMGLVVMLESTRASEFRFARALPGLAWFGFIHGAHEWYEMFQIFAATEPGYTVHIWVEWARVIMLLASFLALLSFGVRLLPDHEEDPYRAVWRLMALLGIYLLGVAAIDLRWQLATVDMLAAADVLARYTLGMPGALLACWALLRERRDFHARGMSRYGRDLIWAALAFIVYGLIGQVFTRSSLIYPSQYINTAFFLRTFGIPVQLVRATAAVAIALTLARALRAFEMESRLRLALANKARIEAQAVALEAQERRVQETEELNIQLHSTARELSAMVEMSRILASTVDLGRMLQDALYQMVHSFEFASCSLIFLKRPDGGLELAAKYRRPDAPAPLSLPAVTRTCADAFTAEQPAGAGNDGVVHILTEESFTDGRMFRTIAVPLHAKGQLFGGVVLTALDEDEPFGKRELGLVAAFSQQLAASVENAGLYQALQQREARLEELLRQLVNTQENERQRIARELHDETGQKLTALAMGLAAVESAMPQDGERAARLVRDLRDLTDQSITELRRVMSDLRPSQLDDLGLVPALRWYVQNYAARNPEINVVLNADRGLHRLPPQHETVLFRVAQEAMTNAARHAHARTVTINVCQDADAVQLEVRDDGTGFDSSERPTGRDGRGFGLAGIRERVALLAGTCAIESQLGHGTRVHVMLPLARPPVAGETL